jgi:hypothetical protein
MTLRVESSGSACLEVFLMGEDPNKEILGNRLAKELGR